MRFRQHRKQRTARDLRWHCRQHRHHLLVGAAGDEIAELDERLVGEQAFDEHEGELIGRHARIELVATAFALL